MAIANSTTFAYGGATTANVFSLPNYFGTVVVENATGVNVELTTDASAPGTGAGTLVIPPNTEGVYGNLMPLPQWNLTVTDAVRTVNGTQLVGNASPTSGTVQGQGGYGGLQLTYTATSASPAVFTASSSTSLANGRVVTLGSSGIPTGFTAGTSYFMVGVSGATFNLALTPGGTGVNSSGTGAGTMFFNQSCVQVTPTASATGNITVCFQ